MQNPIRIYCGKCKIICYPDIFNEDSKLAAIGTMHLFSWSIYIYIVVLHNKYIYYCRQQEIKKCLNKDMHGEF